VFASVDPKFQASSAAISAQFAKATAATADAGKADAAAADAGKDNGKANDKAAGKEEKKGGKK
jgi:hypothetical protein